MSKRKHGNYSSRSSASDRHKTDDNRLPYAGRVSCSPRPDPEARREYDNRRYGDGDGDRPPLKLSRLGAGLPPSESTAMKFEWNNLLAQQPSGSNPAANPGLTRPDFGNENVAYRVNADNGYCGGRAKSGVSDSGVDPSRKFGSFHGGFTSPLGKSHVGISKVDDFRLLDHNPYMGQQVKALFSSGDGFSSGFNEGFRGVSDEFNRSREMAAGPGVSQVQTERLNELVDSNWAQYSANGDFKVPGVQRSDNGDMGTFSSDLLYKKLDPLPPSYLRPSNVDTIDGVNGSLSQWNQLHNVVVDQTQPTISNYQSLSSAEQSLPAGFGFGGDDGLERGREALSYESTLRRLALLDGDQGLDELTTVQMCAMRRRALVKRLRLDEEKSELSYGDNQWNDEDIEERYANIGDNLFNIDQAGICGEDQWNINQNVNFGEDQLNINQNVNFGEDQRNIGRDVVYGEDQRNISRDVAYGENQWNIVEDVTYGEDQWNAEDINKRNSDCLLPSSKLPAPMQEHHGEQVKSSRVGVKRRLGPLKSPGSIKKRLGPLNSPGIVKKRLGPLESPGIVKKRLGPLESPGNVKKHLGPLESPVSVKKCLEPLKSPGSVKKSMGLAQNPPNLDSLGSKLQDQSKSRVSERDDFSGGDGLPKVKGKPAKEEPPENSEDFNKLVDSAFFKHMKGLHENPALRRKFTKCSVCASNKEFSGMVPLATHAFCSKGFRAEHLGFHKALCVLLGWDSAAVSNGTWVQRKLPDAEALAMKEDVVIWPPVVVIHNSSIANKNPDKRVILNNEELEVILTGIGFGGGKAKVCCGIPANHIMVVIFSATFSGFREAEKLHQFFSDNKHGRAEFQQISSAALSNSSEGEQNSVADEANFLYGYLGVAEDLDKIESEIKKWYAVKSRKEILAIANTSL